MGSLAAHGESVTILASDGTPLVFTMKSRYGPGGAGRPFEGAETSNDPSCLACLRAYDVTSRKLSHLLTGAPLAVGDPAPLSIAGPWSEPRQPAELPEGAMGWSDAHSQGILLRWDIAVRRLHLERRLGGVSHSHGSRPDCPEVAPIPSGHG